MAGVKQDESCIQVEYVQSSAMPYSHLLRASMATFADEGNMRAGPMYHVSRFTVVFLDWLSGVVCLCCFGCLLVFGAGLVFCLVLLSHANPVAGPLSLEWLCRDSKDCHCRHDERSNRSKKNT